MGKFQNKLQKFENNSLKFSEKGQKSFRNFLE